MASCRLSHLAAEAARGQPTCHGRNNPSLGSVFSWPVGGPGCFRHVPACARAPALVPTTRRARVRWPISRMSKTVRASRSLWLRAASGHYHSDRGPRMCCLSQNPAPCRQRLACPWRKSLASCRQKKLACLCRQRPAFPSTWCTAALLSSMCNIVGGRTSPTLGTASTDGATRRGSRGPHLCVSDTDRE